MFEKITKLIEVKKIIAIIITVLFTILSLRGDLAPEYIMTIISVVITYYFTSSVEKERIKNK